MSTVVQLPAASGDDALAEVLAYVTMLLGQSPGWRARSLLSHVGPDRAVVVSLRDVIDARIERERDARRRASTGTTTYRDDRDTNAEPYHDAAWSLVRRGLLRPQPLGPGANVSLVNQLFAVTEYGRAWLARAAGEVVVPLEAGRMAAVLAAHGARLGAGYHARSQEAVRCYQAQAYLACCTMCGAAAESITLALAIGRAGSSEQVMGEYLKRGGREAVERRLTHGRNAHERSEYASFLSLLSFWRNEAAHGAETALGEDTAFITLLLLLRYAIFADTRWGDLTAP